MNTIPVEKNANTTIYFMLFVSVTIFTTNVRPFIFCAKTAALQDETTDVMLFQELSGLMHELFGFMILLTSDGKLLYLSDNVADHLGHCMVSSRSCKLVAVVVTLTNHTLKVLCIGLRKSHSMLCNLFFSFRWTWLPRVIVCMISLILWTTLS